MDEQYKRIGERIRARRLSRGMTQSALAGDFITRNMLSLIENGAAAPSLSTLTELARRLDVSVGYFFTDGEKETSRFTKMEQIDRLQNLYLSGEYEECLKACAALPSPDDEIFALIIRCNLALAEQALSVLALSCATVYMDRAVSAADHCMYADPSLKATANYVRRLIRAAGSEEIPRELASPEAYANSAVPTEFIVYMRALCALDEGDTATAATLKDSGLILSPVYLAFVEAGILIANGETEQAFALLKQTYKSEEIGFFTRYHMLTALESCARVTGDFKAAYQYSAQKVHLLETFTSQDLLTVHKGDTV